MLKKAGIITWCDNNGPTNYGQILQCYAMQKLCEKNRIEPMIIQYRKKSSRDFFNGKFKISFMNQIYEYLFKIFIIEKSYNKRIFLFRKFIKENIKLSHPCYDKDDVEAISKKFDYLICGSDQIWNPIWFEPIYGLGFGHKTQHRIAYAPSGVAIVDDWTAQKYTELGKCIDRIDYVSVREQESVDILRKYTGKEIKAVLDPTFLVNVQDWDKIASERLVDESYIFCYIMGSLTPHKLVLKALMKKFNVEKIIFIPSNLVESKVKFARPVSDIGPAEFVSLIKHAKAVCTDSFHGTALSIIYRKQFFTLKRAQKDCEKWANFMRIDNVMKKMNISERLVGSVKDVNAIEDINYDIIEKYKSNEIRKAELFFENALLDMSYK